MHQPGHYGAALLAYAPLGAIAVATGATDLAVIGGVAAFAFAMLPDVDLRVPGLSHRGPTHTVWFALAVGVVVAVALGSSGVGRDSAAGGLVASVGPVALAVFGGLVAIVTVVSHLLADALTPMGVRPFAPVSDRRYTLDVAPADSPAANYLLLAVGVAAIGSGFWLGERVAALLEDAGRNIRYTPAGAGIADASERVANNFMWPCERHPPASPES